MSLNAPAIPKELCELDQWVNWRTEERDGKKTKIPYTPGTDIMAKSNDPATWRSFEAALADVARWDGVGFVFTDQDPYCGVDLDKCAKGRKTIEDWALQHLQGIDSYTEWSQSGNGVHIIARAKLPQDSRHRQGQVEIYDSLRFFCMTGDVLDADHCTIEERQAEIDRFCQLVFPARPKKSTPKPQASSALTDDELLDLAYSAENGRKFSALCAGDWTGYPSPSEGDFALCAMLAFWSGGDAAQIDRLFRTSDLFREKWDSKRGESTYGQETIANAIAGCSEFYHPPAVEKTPATVPTFGAVPGLPDYAVLSTQQEASAQQAGRWLDQYVQFAGDASPMTPTAFHVAAGIAVGSLVIARRLRLRVSVLENAIYPNLYLLFVGPSTIQRKTTALRVTRGLLRAAGLQHFLLADRQTPEALTLDLTTRIPHTFDEWTPDTQGRWLQERAIAAQRGWVLEEASHLLDSFNRDFSAGLLPIVLDLYDSPDEALPHNTIGRGRELIERPYIVIFGVTTYASMAEHLGNRALWTNGFFARFALVGTSQVGTWRFWPEPQSYPTDLVEKLRSLATRILPLPTASIGELERPTESGETIRTRVVNVNPTLPAYDVGLDRNGPAWQQYEAYARATSWDLLRGGAISSQLQPSYGRLGTALIKVAMILAALDSETPYVQIEPRHVYRAQQIVEEWRANLHAVFVNLRAEAGDELAIRIKEILAQSGPSWTTRRDLLRGLSVKWSDIEDKIDSLSEQGEIERRELKPARGPATEEYRLWPEKTVKLSN